MNLSGNFSEVSIQDLLGFLRHGKRTGTLAIRRGEQKAVVALRDGKPFSAQMAGAPRLGELLLASGLSDPITVREATRVQAEEEVWRPLGQILVAFGAIDRERLESLIQQQLELTLKRLSSWARDGGYTFFSGEPTHEGDLSLDLGEQRRHTSSWRAQLQDDREVMLAIAEATLDESGRGGPLASRRPLEVSVQLVSSDTILCQQLAAALPSRLASHLTSQPRLQTTPPTPNQLGAEREAPPPVLVVDLRLEGIPRGHDPSSDEGDDHPHCEELAQLHRRQPEIPIVAIIDSEDSFDRAFSVGAVAAVPARVLALTACIENAASLVETWWRDRAFATHDPTALKSKEAVAAQRPTTATLELMQSISAFAERAILFERAEGGLESAGAFGWSADGRSLAEVTRGLCLDLSCAGALAQSLDDGKPRRLTLSPTSLPAPLAQLIGDPTSREVAILPLPDGHGGINSVLYTDNGTLDAPLEGIEVLQLATLGNIPTDS